jgi:hypothetical protein
MRRKRRHSILEALREIGVGCRLPSKPYIPWSQMTLAVHLNLSGQRKLVRPDGLRTGGVQRALQPSQIAIRGAFQAGQPQLAPALAGLGGHFWPVSAPSAVLQGGSCSTVRCVTVHCVCVRGEGSSPVPLPPPAWARFSKFECFESLMNSSELGFCSSSRPGKSIRFRDRRIEVRYPSAPASHSCVRPSFSRSENGSAALLKRYS